MKLLSILLGVLLGTALVSAQAPPILRTQFTTNSSTAGNSVLVRTTAGGAPAPVTIGAGIAFDGTTLTGTGTNLPALFVNGTNVAGANLTNTATIAFSLTSSNISPSVVANSIAGAQLSIDATAETEIEAVVDLSDLQGAVTDAQVPDTITVALSTLASTVTVVDSTDATSFPAMFDSATGSLAVKTDGGLLYNATTANLTATTFTGALAGNSTTATLAGTVTVVDGTDATSFVGIYDSATGSLAPKTDGALLYDASNGTLATTTFSGAGGGLTLDASGFNGNLTTTDNTLQEVSQKLDDLNLAGGAQTPWTSDINGDGFALTNASGITLASTNAGQVDFNEASANGTSAVALKAPDSLAATVTNTLPSSTGNLINDTGLEAAVEAVVDLQDLQGAVIDSQVPNTITIDLATLASTVTVVDSTDATSSIAMFDSATGSLAAKTDAGLTYNATTGMLTATGFTGPLTGNSSSATTLGANAAVTNLTVYGDTNWTSLIIRPTAAQVTGVELYSGVVAAASRNWGYGLNYDTAGDFVIRESSTNTTAPFSAGTTRFELLSGGGANIGGTVTATTFTGAGGGLTLNAAGFNLNLTTSDDTLQEVAQKFDDFVASGSNAQYVNGTNTTPINITDTATITWTRTAATNALGSVITVPVVDSTDATSFIGLFDSATGNLAPKTDGGLIYNSATATLDTATLTEAGANVPNSGDDLSFFSSTTSSQMRTVMADEVGTGPMMFTRAGVWRAVWIDSGAWKPSQTNPAVAATITAPTGADYVTEDCYGFNDTTEQSVEFKFKFPRTWDAGTIKFTVDWKATSTSGTNVWALKAKSVADKESTAGSWGSEITVLDQTDATANELNTTGPSAALTVGGTPAVGETVYFKLSRKPTDGSDNMSGDGKATGLWIQWLESTTEPAAP